jgi:hypothetical protein
MEEYVKFKKIIINVVLLSCDPEFRTEFAGFFLNICHGYYTAKYKSTLRGQGLL